MNLITLSTVQLFSLVKKMKIVFLGPDSPELGIVVISVNHLRKKNRFNVEVNDLCYFSFIIAIGLETRMLQITSFVGF